MVMRQWRPSAPGARCDVELVLEANNVAVMTARPAATTVDAGVRTRFSAFWQDHAACPLAGRNIIVAR